MIESSHATTLSDDAPLAGGDAWPGDSAVNASAAGGYSDPIRVVGVISATARSLPAEPRARPQVRHAGSPSQRTRVTSATPGTSYGSAPGRSRHPGYWRKPRRCATALQDVSRAQSIDSEAKTANFVRSPLQDLITAQPAVLIGLITHLVGTPLQDDIVRTTDRLLRLV